MRPRLKYNPTLKQKARSLRTAMTDCEGIIWSRLRRKQVLGVQFYRQKPLGHYIVDFYAPKAKLVVEVDGSHHATAEHMTKDGKRDADLAGRGIRVLRFNDLQVLQEIEAVMQEVFQAIAEQVERNPPTPPFCKGGSSE
ncbi:MAG TPA: endonuclease domain-containing protein [Verrucomicrobiae bacterium]|nr:endonuclease domain-containing protein [Verrucomicrobiae bacterium]